MAQHKLVIAEKPSVAQSLAAVIGATVRKDGYLEGNGWRVSWCVGHLAGLADADSYDPKYAKWRYDDLPILPEHWQMVVGKDMIPDLKLSQQPEKTLGKYGRMRKTYLKEHRPILYNQMLMSEKLYQHLLEIDETAQSRLEQMMPQLAKEAGATEELKASDPMKWVGLMNNCKAQAEEILMAELINS